MIHRGSAHYRLSLAGGGTDLGDRDGLCITMSLPWRCHVVRDDQWADTLAGEPQVFDADAGAYGIPVSCHPILRHLPNVEPQHHFIVTHELPTRVGLGSSAALALAACWGMANATDIALAMDHKATGSGWQDVLACVQPDEENGYEDFFPGDMMMIRPDGRRVLSMGGELEESIVLFSTGGKHTESRNPTSLDPIIRAMALTEARRLRDDPTLETLAWCMRAQWERKMTHAPPDMLRAIEAAMHPQVGAMSAKSTGSRGAGFGVVLTKDRERVRDVLLEYGARVWMP